MLAGTDSDFTTDRLQTREMEDTGKEVENSHGWRHWCIWGTLRLLLMCFYWKKDFSQIILFSPKQTGWACFLKRFSSRGSSDSGTSTEGIWERAAEQKEVGMRAVKTGKGGRSVKWGRYGAKTKEHCDWKCAWELPPLKVEDPNNWSSLSHSAVDLTPNTSSCTKWRISLAAKCWASKQWEPKAVTL